MSSPRLLTCLPGDTAASALTVHGAVRGDEACSAVLRVAFGPSRSSTHSAGSTASQPDGSGAPVMMRTAWPGTTGPLKGFPGSESPTTASGSRMYGVAPWVDSATTAYPSIV